jgi:hypothetical protein
METKLTSEEAESLRKSAARFPPLTPERVAEIENADRAAEEIERDGQTSRRCLVCSGPLVVEDIATSYVVRCEKENRIVFTSRGI